MGQLLPVREVGSVGVVTDIRPASLPINAFTKAKNVRFDEGKVGRSPVFRDIKNSLVNTPRFVYGVPASSSGNFASIVLVSDTYTFEAYANNSLVSRQTATVDSTPVTLAQTSPSTHPFTGTSLADIVYINRVDQPPVFMANGGSGFQRLTNWPPGYRAESIRAYGDFLIALNTTEGGTSFPSRVRFSTPALANSVPATWSASDATSSAGFNDLVQMKTGIVDGMTLGTKFIVYSKDCVYLMEFVGGTFIHNFRKLFSDCGVINQNCIAEVEGAHYVFDHNDIYIHDSNTRQSICDERVKSYIFGGLNTAKTNRCFVHHNADLDEVMFCYVSGDDMAEYTSGDRCNRAAVFNYKSQTWSFVDLPNVSSSTTGTISSSITYENTNTYDDIGGSYYSQEAGYDVHNLFVGSQVISDGLSSDKLYGLDLSDTGSLSFDLDDEANKNPFLEREGIDLDEISPLSGYKVITKIIPQVETENSDKNFKFTFGSTDLIGQNVSYGNQINFDGAVDYKIDTRAAGRYLSYKMTVTDNKDFNFLGFDLDVLTTGRR